MPVSTSVQAAVEKTVVAADAKVLGTRSTQE